MTGTTLDVNVPRLNSVDDSYVLLQWFVEDGARVRTGEVIAVLETSKVAADLEATAEGFLRRRVSAGSECAVGEVVASIGLTAVPESPSAIASAEGDGGTSPASRGVSEDTPPDSGAGGKVVVTAPARELAEQHGIDPSRLLALGVPVVRTAEVRSLLEDDATAAAEPVVTVAGERITLSRNQIAVAAAVARSNRDIPAAFAATRVRVDAALSYARQCSRRDRAMIGITELVIRTVASLRPVFPLVFGSLDGPDQVLVPDRVDVGVTVDTGAGLFVPVLRDPADRPLAELARELMTLRRKAINGDFDARELAGAHVVLALNNAEGVTAAVPVVFPGTAACVSVCSPVPTVELDPDGIPRAVPYLQLGLAYDHRIVNGREAGRFLAAVRDLLETPGPETASVPEPLKETIR